MEFPLTITSAFLKRSHARRIFRRSWSLIIAVALILSGLALKHPGKSWGTIDQFGILCLIFGTLVVSVAWFKQVASIKDWVRKQGSDPIIYRLSEDVIEVSSKLGS